MHNPVTRSLVGSGSPVGSGRLLVIATGHNLSLALLEGGDVLAECDLPMVKGHAEALIPAIAKLMERFGGPQARCEAVVVETGPGSFTGLRVGLAAGRALALAWSASLRGVRSTQLVAADARSAGAEGTLLVALAAPRGQVWVEGFAAPAVRPIHPPQALSLADAAGLATRFDRLVGTATPLLSDGAFPTAPRAGAIAALDLGDLGEADIQYVRAPDARDQVAVPG